MHDVGALSRECLRPPYILCEMCLAATFRDAAAHKESESCPILRHVMCDNGVRIVKPFSTRMLALDSETEFGVLWTGGIADLPETLPEAAYPVELRRSNCHVFAPYVPYGCNTFRKSGIACADNPSELRRKPFGLR